MSKSRTLPGKSGRRRQKIQPEISVIFDELLVQIMNDNSSNFFPALLSLTPNFFIDFWSQKVSLDEDVIYSVMFIFTAVVVKG